MAIHLCIQALQTYLPLIHILYVIFVVELNKATCWRQRNTARYLDVSCFVHTCTDVATYNRCTHQKRLGLNLHQYCTFCKLCKCRAGMLHIFYTSFWFSHLLHFLRSLRFPAAAACNVACLPFFCCCCCCFASSAARCSSASCALNSTAFASAAVSTAAASGVMGIFSSSILASWLSVASGSGRWWPLVWRSSSLYSSGKVLHSMIHSMQF